MKKLMPESSVCAHCGASLSDHGQALKEDPQTINLIDTPSFTGECPQCATPLFLEDGFCAHCGTSFCYSCGQMVSEDDDICPHCHKPLFFDCPLCNFELTAGTDQCPNCEALIPSFCTHCHISLLPGVQACPQCQTNVTVIRRKSARIIHSLMVADQVVQVASCPSCGHQIHLHEGKCDCLRLPFLPTMSNQSFRG